MAGIAGLLPRYVLGLNSTKGKGNIQLPDRAGDAAAVPEHRPRRLLRSSAPPAPQGGGRKGRATAQWCGRPFDFLQRAGRYRVPALLRSEKTKSYAFAVLSYFASKWAGYRVAAGWPGTSGMAIEKVVPVHQGGPGDHRLDEYRRP